MAEIVSKNSCDLLREWDNEGDRAIRRSLRELSVPIRVYLTRRGLNFKDRYARFMESLYKIGTL